MKTIVYVNPKGGAGKSTSSIALANTLAYHYGKEVVLVSTDTQQTSQNLRNSEMDDEDDSDNYYEIFGTTSDYCLNTILPDKAQMDKDGIDFLIIDTPGYVDPNTFLIARQADIVLVPVKLSRIDLTDFTNDLVNIIKNELFNFDPACKDKTFWYPNEVDKRTASYKDFIANQAAFENIGINIMPPVASRENFKHLDTISFPDIDDKSIRPIMISYTKDVLDRLGLKLNESILKPVLTN